MGRRIGYGRGSDWGVESTVLPQQATFYRANCEKVFFDPSDRIIKTNIQWRNCLAYLRTNDTLVIFNLANLSGHYLKLVKIFAVLRNKQIRIEVMHPHIVFDESELGQAKFEAIGLYPKFLDDCKASQQMRHENPDISRPSETFKNMKGAWPALNQQEIQILIQKSKQANFNLAAQARTLGVSRTTIYKYLNAKLPQ